MKNISIFIKILFVVWIPINAQTVFKHNLDSVVVTANRVPTLFSQVGRSITVISQKEIELLPVSNIQDLLDYSSGIDVKQRGPEGIQADISIRGGSFEQTLILIDGIKLTDPQTGHHNMNLPISLEQVERVEILKGQGSRIYGANAFSGVINIITKKNSGNNLRINLQGGENSFYKLNANGSFTFGKTNHHINFSKTKSDGYRFNTGFENYNFSVNNSFNLSKTVINTIYGYTNKDFGANSFYTTRFPKQAEKTKTHLAAISADITLTDFNLQPKLYWRRNDDEFVLDKDNPSFYKNNHLTNVYGSELQVTTNIFGGTTSFGIEYTQDQITSNNLGKHTRERKGLFIEQKVNLSRNLNFTAGGFAYNYSNFGWKFWPGFDLSYSLNDDYKIFANFGRAFRIPTYTELYYSDPVTKGNSNLIPEESINYEIGVNYQHKIVQINSAYFIKKSTNLIDYILDNSENLWNAKNLTEINTNGVELGILLNLESFTNSIFRNLKADYTYLSSNKTDLNITSRYILDYLKHDFSIHLNHILPFNIEQSWVINYEDRITLDDNFTIDTKLSKNFQHFNIFLKVSNLLNNIYEEIPGVPLPGRWIIGGIKINVL